MRGREHIQLYDRVISKGSKGLEELAAYMKRLADEYLEARNVAGQPRGPSVEIQAILVFFLDKARIPPNNQSQRTYLIQGLENIGFELKDCEDFQKNFKQIANSVLQMMEDVSEKVRLTAVGSLYNLLNVYSQRGLQVFLPSFETLAQLVTDDSGQVRQAAAFLNQSLKTMINEAMIDQLPFDLRAFIEVLAEKIQGGGAIFREFLLDWLMTIEEVPHFQLSFDLPLFFPQVFQLLLSDCKSLRTKAEQCLKKFLHVFREILALGGNLSSKLRPQNAQILVETVLLLVRQNLSPQVTLQSLEWLQMFTRFFSLEVVSSGEKFIEPIYSAYFRDIILVVITCLSDDSQRVRKTSQRINEALLDAFPTMVKEQRRMSETGALLHQLLEENRLPIRVEAILKWIILLLHHNSEQILEEISHLMEHLVERLCDRAATRALFLLLEGSLFVERYFPLLVQILLNYLSKNQQVPPQPIFRQLLSLSNAEEQFLQICRKVKQFQNSRFQYKLLENLISLLVTEHSLEGLRSRLEVTDRDVALELFECFCKNQAALVILGFLSRQYFFVIGLFRIMALWQRLSDYKLRSLVRTSNLIEHSNLNQLRTDLRRSGLAVKAYLSLLMAVPHGKYHNLLLQRLPPGMKPLPEELPSQSQRIFAQEMLKTYECGWKEVQRLEVSTSRREQALRQIKKDVLRLQ